VYRRERQASAKMVAVEGKAEQAVAVVERDRERNVVTTPMARK